MMFAGQKRVVHKTPGLDTLRDRSSAHRDGRGLGALAGLRGSGV
jgi:hypothetical protein